jgi:uncharacterized membrane protein YbhN (UPF0104 family)
MTRRRSAITTAVGAAVGTVLLIYAVQRVGFDELVDGVTRVGWGIVAILALAGARFLLRAQCWRWCLPPGIKLDFPHAFSAFLAGDAVGNVTPLGLLASEPTKVLLTRHHLATLDSVASLTLENVLYSISVMAMLAFGVGLLLATVTVPTAVWWFGVGSLVAIAVVATGAVSVLRMPVSAGASATGWRARLVRVREEVTTFARQHPSRLIRVFALQLLFHVLAVTETFMTLRWLLGRESPTAVQAVVFETVNRVTIVAFKFVPFRIGIDEAVSGAVAPLLAVTASAGVALAVIRKVRVLFWSGIGLTLVAAHPVRRSPSRLGSVPPLSPEQRTPQTDDAAR